MSPPHPEVTTILDLVFIDPMIDYTYAHTFKQYKELTGLLGFLGLCKQYNVMWNLYTQRHVFAIYPCGCL